MCPTPCLCFLCLFRRSSRISSIGICISGAAVFASCTLSTKLSWANQAFRSKSYQIHAAGHFKTFQNQFTVFRIFILHQRTLDCLLMRIFRYINLLSCKWMNSCIIHTGGKCRWSRIKILHLFRCKSKIPDIFREFHRFFHGTARMGRHKVRNCVLLFARMGIGILICL